MKTIILDDDPTGTQSASEVRVLLKWDAKIITEALREADSVYLQTNSRAINETQAITLASEIRTQALESETDLGEEVFFILRGDSTLRGHVFSETKVFMKQNSIILFVPAYPAVGRTTRNGTHFVKVNGIDRPASETEFAKDPVFPFSTSYLPDYTVQKSGRSSVVISLDMVRGNVEDLVNIFANAKPGEVLLPDVETDEDIEGIAKASLIARERGVSIVVRCAAPLAAVIAGVASKGLLQAPIRNGRFKTLLVTGSHTEGATAQLAKVAAMKGEPEVVSTSLAFTNPTLEVERIAKLAKERLLLGDFASITTERERLVENNTLAHGEIVMTALVEIVKALAPYVDVVISKGGITSAEVARTGLGATSAWVLGQILPGISVWQMVIGDGRKIIYVVVPGNVGDEGTLIDVLERVGVS